MTIARPTWADIRDERRLMALLTRLVESANRMENLTGGPGVAVLRSAGGVSVSLTGTGGEARSKPGEAAEGQISDTKTLGWQQGVRDTDTWTRSETGPGVQVRVVTDIQFNSSDPNNLTLTMRSRTLHFDSAGCLYNISAEDEQQTVITTAVLCQESP